MKKVFVVVVLAILLGAHVGLGSDGVSISFFPDTRAPSIFIEGTHSLLFSFAKISLKEEVGLWTYVDNPPTGYGPIFYVFNLTPAISFSLSNGWTCNINSLLQYRTNLPNKIIIAPQISIWHPW